MLEIRQDQKNQQEEEEFNPNNDTHRMRDILEKLGQWFREREHTITAFSGGIDSSLVLFLSNYFLGQNAMGCISDSASLKRRDLELAVGFCEQYGIQLEIIKTDEMANEDYLQNPANRCYFCKNHLYMALDELRKRYPGYIILNGTNTNDLGDYRPGLQAAEQHQVQSPLVDCGIDKDMVRQIARHFDIKHWDKPASPCLSSRVPYGHSIDATKLEQIEKAEEVMLRYGFSDVRVRHYHNEARIEVPEAELKRLREVYQPIAGEIELLGFDKCSIDGEGLVSGKLNRVLQ